MLAMSSVYLVVHSAAPSVVVDVTGAPDPRRSPDRTLAGHGNTVAARADVTDDLDVERLFAETTHTFGGVDVVIHAVQKPVGASPIVEVDLDHFDALCLATIRSTFIVNRRFTPSGYPGSHLVGPGNRGIVRVLEGDADTAESVRRGGERRQMASAVCDRRTSASLRESSIWTW
jgi:NAD(P)-dependent dehydrogenase (short-subunit alcohol dehydrogenase family)